jgi:hypothetical protein
MLSTFLDGVTFLVPDRSSLSPLKDWYDGLEDSEVKRAIVRLRLRILKDGLRPWVWVYVLTRHPDRDEVASLKQAREIGKSLACTN